jgi:putative Ca2+/H+ antiporter (TMEM165/GDT1 family)
VTGGFDAFWVSTGIVALSEIGDKTQLLALLLAARFRRPVPIISGIFVATIANHAAAAALGSWLQSLVDPQWMRWVLGLSFLAVAAWMLIPDKVDEGETAGAGRWGVFGVTVVAFFLAEMGDKTQVATVLLAARYSPLWQVVAGTTLGMLVANVPVVFLGSRFADRLPLRAARIGAAVLFLALGLWVLFAGP